MIFRKRKNKTMQEPRTLCEGIKLDGSIYQKQEKRLGTLAAKGILVYLICAGSMGCILTAAGTPYSAGVLHVILLLSAIGLSCMYYRKAAENIGGLLLTVLLMTLGIQLYSYINSGFYAVLNDLNEQASNYFGLTGVRVFAERINNRRIATTVSMAFLGVIENVILNMLLVRKMRYLSAAAVSLPLLLFPVYIQCEPDVFYVGMLMAGLMGAFVWRRSGHFVKVDSNTVYRTDKKNNISFVYHKKALAAFLFQTVVWVVLVVTVVSLIIPREEYMEGQKISTWKLQTRGTVENVILLGLAGVMNRYDNTGGMSSGRLGGIGSVNLDYNTDLELRIAPYSYQTIYLKSFTGGSYIPYENRWMRAEEEQDNAYEALQLRHAFLNGNAASARGRAEIENVAAPIALYLPYYSTDTGKIGLYGETVEYTYYPRLTENTVSVEQKIDRDYWLRIPADNYDTIAQFCESAGFSGSREEVIAQVVDYYQQEIPYTLRPGATPRRQDFINYFLERNQKGYCAHFASAATLIFRYMGIPTRYVEGYAVSYDQILEGTLVTDAEYRDYYEGYSELGETALVEVDITDADAHAWVEVYDEEKGWEVVEVTPYSTEDILRTDFWSMFLNLLGGEEAQEEEAAGEDGTAADFDFTPIRTAVGIVLVVFVAAVMLFFLIRQAARSIRYLRACLNDRMILKYTAYLRKNKKKYPLLKEKLNYREQLSYLTEVKQVSKEHMEEMVTILEKAGFSNRSITPEEVQFLKRNLFRKGKKITK